MWMRVISGCVLVVTLNVPGAYAQRDTRPTNQLLVRVRGPMLWRACSISRESTSEPKRHR